MKAKDFSATRRTDPLPVGCWSALEVGAAL